MTGKIVHMAAQDHLSGQLKLFVTPKEIMDSEWNAVETHEPLKVRGDNEFLDEFWGRKQRQAEQSGLTSHIAQHGIQNPIVMGTDARSPFRDNPPEGISPIISGYHRVAAAHSINPNMPIPVVYRSMAEQSMEDRYQSDDQDPLPTSSRIRNLEGEE
jgi:hypothetical protein